MVLPSFVYDQHLEMDLSVIVCGVRQYACKLRGDDSVRLRLPQRTNNLPLVIKTLCETQAVSQSS